MFTKSIPYIFFILLLVSCSQQERPQSKGLLKPKIIASPARANSSLPYLVKGADGNLYFSWIEKSNSGPTRFLYASFVQDQWTEPELIASGRDWFVNWADYPMIAVNNAGDMIGHYLKKSAPDTYAYNVNVVRKKKHDTVWSLPLNPHTDSTRTEHGFVSMLPQADNTFLLVWLDGRNTGVDNQGHKSAMTIRSTVLTIEGDLSDEKVIDERVCDCCQTDGTMTTDGPVAVFRDRSELEIRDISSSRKTDQGWTAPKSVFFDNWIIAGCPVNGPRADAIGNNLVVAWYSAVNDFPEVKAVFSIDGGASYGPAMIIDNKEPLGRVDEVMLDENRAMISWLATERGNTLIKTREVSLNSQMGDPIVVASTSESRSSGFPQMARHGNQLYFAWTSVENEKSVIRMATVAVPSGK